MPVTIQDALGFAEHAVPGGLAEAADDILGVAGGAGRAGAADQELLDGQREERQAPGDPPAADDSAEDAPQPGGCALLFRVGDGGQARPDMGGLLIVGGLDIEGLLAVGGLDAHDFLRSGVVGSGGGCGGRQDDHYFPQLRAGGFV
jgi:hypothetical protein